MEFEDKTLQCTQCRESFVFTAGEQAFYSQRGFTEPKRCKKCRDNRRQKKKESGGRDQIYRSPAFEESAPAHQKIRRRGAGRGGRRAQEYRSPGFRERGAGTRAQEYRSPAFREQNLLKPEHEYRAPGFREHEGVDANAEYRAPGFREYADLDVNAEYRAPGYQDLRDRYVDQKPEFSIICARCGVEAMVPYLPEEDEEPLCRSCHRAQRGAAEVGQEYGAVPDSSEGGEPADEAELSGNEETQ